MKILKPLCFMSVVFVAINKPKQILCLEETVPGHLFCSYSYCFSSTQTSAEKLSTMAVCKNFHNETWIYKALMSEKRIFVIAKDKKHNKNVTVSLTHFTVTFKIGSLVVSLELNL